MAYASSGMAGPTRRRPSRKQVQAGFDEKPVETGERRDGSDPRLAIVLDTPDSPAAGRYQKPRVGAAARD